MNGLSQGMRVVEAALFIAAPSCALHLAQMGAEVVRIDQISGGPDSTAGRWRPAAAQALAEILGLSAGEIGRLHDAGLVTGTHKMDATA